MHKRINIDKKGSHKGGQVTDAFNDQESNHFFILKNTSNWSEGQSPPNLKMVVVGHPWGMSISSDLKVKTKQ